MQHVTTTVYDNKRRPTSIAVPLNTAGGVYNTTTFSYERGSANANTHTQRAFGTMTLWSGKRVVRTYSGNGRLLASTAGYNTGDAATTQYTYFPGGRPKTVTNPRGKVTQYAYDSIDRLATVTDPLGHVTQRFYWPSGYGTSSGGLATIQYPDNTRVNFFNYEATGHAQTIQDQNSYAASQQGQTPWYETHYYDNTARPTAIYNARNPSQPVTFTYNDPRGLLTSTNFPDGTHETVVYDPVGNVQTTTNRAGTVCTLGY